MSDLLAEVDEALRYERIEEFWKKYGTLIIAAIVILIVGTATISGYRTWDKNVKETQTAQVFALLDAPSFPSNVLGAPLDLRGSLKAIVLLRAGEAFSRQGDTQNAIAVFERAGQDNSIEQDLRQLSLLQALRLKAAQEGADYAAIMTSLEPITNDESSPWQSFALLDAAIVASSGLKDYGRALDFVNQVLDSDNAPETLRNRASQLAHVLQLQAKAITEDQDS